MKILVNLVVLLCVMCTENVEALSVGDSIRAYNFFFDSRRRILNNSNGITNPAVNMLYPPPMENTNLIMPQPTLFYPQMIDSNPSNAPSSKPIRWTKLNSSGDEKNNTEDTSSRSSESSSSKDKTSQTTIAKDSVKSQTSSAKSSSNKSSSSKTKQVTQG